MLGKRPTDHDGRLRDRESPYVLIVSGCRPEQRQRVRSGVAALPTGPRESDARAGVGRVRSRE